MNSKHPTNRFAKTKYSTLLIIIFFLSGFKENENPKSTEAHREDNQYLSTDDLNGLESHGKLELIDITRFFEKPIENHEVEKFQDLKVEITGSTLIIEDSKTQFIKKEMSTKKYLGKGSLYSYFTEYLAKKFDINAQHNVTYIKIDEEDTKREPFKRFFLMNNAIYMSDHLFLYSSNDYLITFKHTLRKVKNLEAIYKNLNTTNLPLEYSFELTHKLKNSHPIPQDYQHTLQLEYRDNYSGLKLPNPNKSTKLILISARQPVGETDIYIYTLSNRYEKLDKLVLFTIEGETLSGNNAGRTFKINSDHEIQITERREDDTTIKTNYIINEEGKFIKIK